MNNLADSIKFVLGIVGMGTLAVLFFGLCISAFEISQYTCEDIQELKRIIKLNKSEDRIERIDAKLQYARFKEQFGEKLITQMLREIGE